MNATAYELDDLLAMGPSFPAAFRFLLAIHLVSSRRGQGKIPQHYATGAEPSVPFTACSVALRSANSSPASSCP